MSKPRDRWWSYVKNVIRAYPMLKDKHNTLLQPTITTSLSRTGSGAISDPTYVTATRQMEPQEEWEYEAVRRAIEVTERYAGGTDRIRLIRGMYWTPGGNMRETALRIPCSNATAKRWNGDFVRLVAVYMGLLQ